VVEATIVVACATPPAEADATTIRIATGRPNGPFRAAGEALVRRYRAVLPNASPELVMTRGGPDNVAMLESEDADIAFAYANVAYAGFVGQMSDQTVPFERLRGMALLQTGALHVVSAPGSSGRRLEDLRGRRADFGGPASALAAALVLNAFGLNAQAIRVASTDGDDPSHLLRGDVSALFALGVPPMPSMQTALAGGARLLPVEGPHVDELLREYPFYSATVIHPETYAQVSKPVATIGINGVLLCRHDLDDQTVYQLTKALYESSSGIAVEPVLAWWLDESVGAATPVPLHPGAARYYRERELSR
jgi:hypothetical protein